MKSDEVIKQIRKWIELFIIKYDICPFAAYPYKNQLIHFMVSDAIEREDQLYDLVRLFVKMMSTDRLQLSNAFIIFSRDESDFQDFLFMEDMAGLLLNEYGYGDDLQVVIFHPDFRYGNENKGDPSNLTNRSPYPMIHVLRKGEIERAINSLDSHHSVTDRNRDLLKSMDEKTLHSLIALISRVN